jgi:antitoxin YefM
MDIGGFNMTTTRETKELTTVDARKKLTKLPEELGDNPATEAVTRRGKPVLAIMTWKDYEAILETLEILSDDKAVEQLRHSIKEVKEGKTYSWKDAKARLAV